MTQAVAMIRSLIATERLLELCNAYDIPAVTMRKIASEVTEPTYEIINILKTQINPNRWFDEADNNFIETLETQVAIQKKKNKIKNDYTVRYLAPEDVNVSGEFTKKKIDTEYNKYLDEIIKGNK